MGTAIAANDMALVYGGGRVGLMGIVADAAIAGGAPVYGVIPGFLEQREVAHPTLTECVVTDDLMERKTLMIEKSDAFIALPGGLGTYDELFEVIAWRQLGQLTQPIGLLNLNGFFDPWLNLMQHTATEGFVREEEFSYLVVEQDPTRLLDGLRAEPASPGD